MKQPLLLLLLATILADTRSVDAFPPLYTCANSEKWQPNLKFGEMGIDKFSDGGEADCSISVVQVPSLLRTPPLPESDAGSDVVMNPSSLDHCGFYTVKVSSSRSLGHKLKVSEGELRSSSDFKSTAQKDASQALTCRNAADTHKESRYIFRAPHSSETGVTFQALCGSSSSGKMYVAPSLTIPVKSSSSPCPPDDLSTSQSL